MRLAILSAALAFAVTPAFAGGAGGGCNWAAKQVTAEAPADAEPMVEFASLEPITEKWLLIRDEKTVADLVKMIEETPVTQ